MKNKSTLIQVLLLIIITIIIIDIRIKSYTMENQLEDMQEERNQWTEDCLYEDIELSKSISTLEEKEKLCRVTKEELIEIFNNNEDNNGICNAECLEKDNLVRKYDLSPVTDYSIFYKDCYEQELPYVQYHTESQCTKKILVKIK